MLTILVITKQKMPHLIFGANYIWNDQNGTQRFFDFYNQIIILIYINNLENNYTMNIDDVFY